MKLAAVILAAGFSSRMKEFKPLLELGGQSLLARCAVLFRGAGIADICVVTGHRHREVEAEAARLGLLSLHNPQYQEGMYASACAAMPHLRQVDGFFLLPVDIPLIRSATLTALSAAFDGRETLFPTFAGQRGHPPLIPSRLIPDILGHDGRGGHGGLRALLENKDHREVAVWDRGILIDADTPEDFAALIRREQRLTIGEPAEAEALARLVLPDKGVAHGLAVARVATALGQELNRHGSSLDRDLLHNGALLHDIAKGQPRHEARGAELLAALGLMGLAEIVAVHRDLAPPAAGKLTEKEVVCLADKLVRGSFRVTVQRRFAEKLERYADDRQTCRAIRRRLADALTLQSLVERAVGRKVTEILGPAQLT